MKRRSQADLFASDPPSTERSEVQRWIDWACTEWTAVHVGPFIPAWGRDMRLVKPLLTHLGEPELSARWQAHVRTEDHFLARSGWDILSFVRAINRYTGAKDRSDLMRLWLKRKAERRDPLTGKRIA